VDKVVFMGARHLKEQDLRELTGVVAGRPLNPPANKLACKRITAKLNEMGYPFATCTLVKGGEPGDKDVVFEITEGRKVKVRDIQFIGNSWVSSSRLSTQVRSSFVWFHLPGGTYNPQMVDSDIKELIKYYRWAGFWDAQVSSLEMKWEPDGSEVTLIFHINEGPRSRAQDTAAKDRTPAIPSAPVPSLPVGKETQEPARVGQIVIKGNTTVSSASILAHVALYPGQVLSFPDLQEAEKRLAGLGLFVVDREAGVGPTVTVIDTESESCFKDILITVKEKPAAKP
jgi:outer membrane protein insertion porin family